MTLSEEFMELQESLSALEIASLRPRPEDLVPELPRMSTYAQEVLRESIQSEGQLSPILVTSCGMILDGVERWEAMSALGFDFIQCRIIEVSVENPMALQNLVWAANVERRELLPEHRAMAIKALGRINWSSRKLAAWLGISKSTAHVARSEEIGAVQSSDFGRLNTIEAIDSEAQPIAMSEGINGRRYPIKQATPEEISRRRAKVHKLKADGFSIREIASLVKVSVGTVSADLEAPAPDPRIIDKPFDPYELTPKLKRAYRVWVRRPPVEKAALAYALLQDLGSERAMEIFEKFRRR